MSQRANTGEGRENESDSNHSIQMIDNPTTTKAKIASHDSNLDEFHTPAKNEKTGSKSGNSSNSSNSSGSGGDNNYSADCSGDGGSDDNQSSDDTSGKPKQHAMMLDSSAMLAHHHHQQQQGHHHHQHHKHKGVSKQYNDNTSSGSSSSNDDDDDEDMRKNKKSQTTNNYNNHAENNQRSNQEGVEQTQEQLSLLSTNAKECASTNTTPTVQNNKSNSGIIDPQIDLSLVNHIPSSSLVLPLHATATAALLQWNQSNHLAEPTLESNQNTTCTTSTSSIPMNCNNSVPDQYMMPQTLSNPSENWNGLPAATWLTAEKYMHLMEVSLINVYVST
jgi:hypothetical protein